MNIGERSFPLISQVFVLILRLIIGSCFLFFASIITLISVGFTFSWFPVSIEQNTGVNVFIVFLVVMVLVGFGGLIIPWREIGFLSSIANIEESMRNNWGRDFQKSEIDRKKYEETESEERITVENSVYFYSNIAENYDTRQSDSYINSQSLSVKFIVDWISSDKQNSKFRILDLGGGTGFLFPSFVKFSERVEWVNYDASVEMQRVFSRKFKGFDNYKQFYNNIFEIENAFEDEEQFDVVFINFVLSSLREFPNFYYISRLLKPGGYLIVTEADPSYNDKFPSFRSPGNNSFWYSLSLNPIHQAKLMEVIGEKTELSYVKALQVSKGNGDPYAYVLIFEK